MFAPLQNRVFRRLYAAQLIALFGTGLLTVALALLAYDLAGARAGAVLGAALTLKMVAYVCVAPLADALLVHVPRRVVLIGADAIRAAIALMLPFVDAVWQVYLLVFLLQAASASFTPVFQAVIPDIVKDEDAYTDALSLSRLAYEFESLLSPSFAALLLLFLAFNALFAFTAIGFLISALLIMSVRLPPLETRERPFRERLTHGIALYLATPRLRGLLTLNIAIAAVVGFVLVNSVVLVRVTYGGAETDLALAMAAFGLGAVGVALALPDLLQSHSDRQVMLISAWGLAFTGVTFAALLHWSAAPWPVFLVAWMVLGACNSGVLTPAGRLLRRSSDKADRPALFTAQFTLSHLCWLVGYPAAGFLGASLGLSAALLIAAIVAGSAALSVRWIWPS